MGLNQGNREQQRADAWLPWTVPVVLVLLSTFAALAGETGREWLRYDRPGIGNGELWRLVTGHLVHLGTSHLVLNLAGLLLVWYLVGGYMRTAAWLLVLVTVMLGIDAGLWWLQPQLVWYVGLSGLLHGLLAAGVLTGFAARRAENLFLAAALVAKLVYEQLLGPLPGSEASSGGNVIVAAHLYGALSGLFAGWIVRIRVLGRAPI